MSQDNLLELARTFAPIVYLAGDEPNLPANVDWFLSKTRLVFADGSQDSLLISDIGSVTSQGALLSVARTCTNGSVIRSNGTRSVRKRCTFFLSDLPNSDRIGMLDPSGWTTYLHIYPNVRSGVNIQYWRFHVYNTGKTLPFGLHVGYHGGDWEGVFIEFDSSYSPVTMNFLGHTDITAVPWGDLEFEDSRPVVYCERGGHSSSAHGNRDGIRQETHGGDAGAMVRFPGGLPTAAGALLDVGSKLEPRNGQVFIQYSGLWGSPSEFSLLGSDPYYWSSGYWGPAFNETERAGDGFMTAWGKNAKDGQLMMGNVREFYADEESA